MRLPELGGYLIRRRSPADTRELQVLYERCSDYHEQHEGIPTRPSAAEEELVALPPGKTLSDKFSLGIYGPDNQMVGYLDLVRDFPSTGEWHIGLLMLDPRVRSAGLGSRIYEAAAAWVTSRGGHTTFLGVLEQVPRAEQFWRRLGFEEVSRQSYTSETGRSESRIIIMRHMLAHPPAA